MRVSSTRWTRPLVALALLGHLALALLSVRDKSATFDESAHITAGFAYWSFDDYRLHPENGNLPQRIAALPLVLAGERFPDRKQEAWERSDVIEVGDQFLFRSGNDAAAMLRRGRAMIALVSTLLCLVVFLWARSLFGNRGGIVALLLYAFSPLVIAHGQLATSDATAALFFTLAAWSFWACLRRLTWPRLAGCAASVSGLALSKMSAALFLPMAVLMTAGLLLFRRPVRIALGRVQVFLRSATARLAASAGILAACALAAWGAVWLAYGLRFEPYPPGEAGSFRSYNGPGLRVASIEEAAQFAGAPGRVLEGLARGRVLPEPFLWGSTYVLAALHRYAFLNGEHSTSGWRHFFPYAFLVKTTLPMLLLLAGAGALAVTTLVRRARPHRIAALSLRLVPLAALLVVYWASLVSSTINIGARHMLPAFPATCVLAGALGRTERRRATAWAVAFLLLWHVGEGLRAYPNYLASFNELVPRGEGWRHMVDSNLDWGQDLPGLKRYLDRRLAADPGRKAFLSYFGTGSPEYHGIPAEPLDFEERARRGLPPVGGAGTYCVSATNLQAVYLRVHGRWSREAEREYQEMLARLAPGRGGVGSAAAGGEEDPAHAEGRHRFNDLATARLMAFLRRRDPDDQIGYSILVYDLTEADLRQALDGPPPELHENPRIGG